jgi:Fe-S cluster biogenesis protein NfuA
METVALETMRAEIDSAMKLLKSRLRGHGGDAVVTDVTDGVVTVDFQGACRGCPAQAFTLLGAVEPALTAVAGVTAVNTARSTMSPMVLDRIRRAQRATAQSRTDEAHDRPQVAEQGRHGP